MGRILGLILLMSIVAGPSSFADGMGSPWPFPWAQECPMAWETLGGLYRMSNSNARDQILVKVNQGDDADVKIIRMVRLSAKGRVRAFGLAMVLKDEREFSVHMIPATEKDGSDNWVTVRMYYASSILSCDMSALVPIMSVSQTVSSSSKSEYVLIRLENQGRKK